MRETTKVILPVLQKSLLEGQEDFTRAAVANLLPPDIADICHHLEAGEAARLLTVLPLEAATDALEHLEPEDQDSMVELLGRARLVAMLDAMNPDDRADLMRRLPDRAREAFMPLLAQAERNDLKRLLAYPEETAGALMTTEYVWLRAELTAEEALQQLRRVAPDSETIYYVYVVDAERRLRGVVSLRQIISARPGKRLGGLMTESPVYARLDQDQEEVAQIFEKYDLQALPVVDPDPEAAEGAPPGKLVGIITFDDIMDVLQDEATEDVQMLGGVAPLDESYMQSSIFHLVRKRLFWLVVLLMAQNVTAFSLGYFKDQFAVETATAAIFLMLVPFIPLVNSSGGNAGSQSATLVTRALATGDVVPRDTWRVLGREVASGVALGLCMGVVGLIPVLLWGSGAGAMLVVAGAVCTAVLIGAILGTVVPLGFHLVGIDPAVASAPLIASISDVIGITTYFTLAYVFLL